MPEHGCATQTVVEVSEPEVEDDVDDVVRHEVGQRILQNHELRFHSLPWVRAEYAIGLCRELLNHAHENVRRYAALRLREWRRFYPELVDEFCQQK